MKTALIVHGGAGRWRPGSDDDALAGTAAAVEAGRKVLRVARPSSRAAPPRFSGAFVSLHRIPK